MTQNKPKLQQQNRIAAYQQFCRLFLINNVLVTQLRQINYDKIELNGKLHRLLRRIDDMGQGGNTYEDKKRRIRRAASEIQRRFKCQNEQCGKSYGSEGSLNQHVKLKHPELYQPFQQALLQDIPATVYEKISEDNS